MDHKPNLEQESNRIKQAGGKIKRMKNEKGQPVGPWRVWRPGFQYPGIAMSRSIGDQEATDLGVICEPMIKTLEIQPGRDRFVILGSDGVWDAISNLDAVNFVQKYSRSCVKTQGKGTVKKATPKSCNIAQLLCEQARKNWLEIVRHEDVSVDDISAIVIELPSIDPKSSAIQLNIRRDDLEEVEEEVLHKLSDISDFTSSTGPGAEELKDRIDIKRNSITRPKAK